MRKIKLVIDEKLLDEYLLEWKKFHPTARNHPLAKPNAKDKSKGYIFVISINEFTNISMRAMQNNLKQNWSSFIQWWCKKQKINGWKLEYAKINYRWFFPDNRRRDADNFGMAQKFIGDGLVKAEVLVDDCLGRVWIEYDCHKYVDKEHPRVEITIEEINNFEDIGTYTKINNERLYRIWSGMKTRCYNKNASNYCSYGGRGVTICDNWKNSFEEFCIWAYSNGYADNLSIDRIDVDGNYEPNNCRWVDEKVQANNRTSNHLITIEGVTKTIQQWADEAGITRYVVEHRLAAGLEGKVLLMNKEEFKESDFSHQGQNDGHLIEYNGETHNEKEWAEKYGLTETCLRQRLNEHKSPIDKALLSKEEYAIYRKDFNKHLKTFDIDGESHTLKEWSEISGINYSTLKRRINRDGVDIKTALLPSKDYRKRGK